MSNLVTVRPKKGSKKFFVDAKIYKEEIGPKGEQKGSYAETGNFKGERFPRSRQLVRPIWSNSRARYLVNLTEKELNVLVKQAGLRYVSGPNKGEPIISSDVRNFSDAFMTHKDLKITQAEGMVHLNRDIPIDRIILACMESDPTYQSLDNNNPLLSSRVKYVIADSEVTTKVNITKMQQEVEATLLFSALNADKRLKVAMAMNLGVNEKSDPDFVAQQLYAAVTGSGVFADGTKKIDMFSTYCKLSTEALNLNFTIARATKRGLVRKNKKEGYTVLGIPMAKTLDELYSVMADPDNSDLLLRLEKNLDSND